MFENVVAAVSPAVTIGQGIGEAIVGGDHAPPKDLAGFYRALGQTGGQMVRGVVDPLATMGKRAIGADEKQKPPLRPLEHDEIMALLTLAVSPTPKTAVGETAINLRDTYSPRAGGAPLVALTDADRVGKAAESLKGNAPKVETKAGEAVSRAFGGGGAPPAADVFEELKTAQRTGQPLVLADVASPEVKNLVGTIYRQGGAAAKRIKDFFEARNAGATPRVEGLINDQLSDLSMRDTAKKLANNRSTNARPIFDEAMAGGSLAPLETQFGHALDQANRAVVDAQQRVVEANNLSTTSAARQSQAGNVYSASGANANRTAATAAAQEAKTGLDQAAAERDAMRERFNQAQADGSANAPGAVWSPELQRFLDQPEIKQGLARGYAIERRRAVGEGKPFNPREYAIVGEDEAGEPIVGKVPNMKLLAVAKEGLDSIIESEAMKDALTGRPNKTGLSYIKLRDGFRNELVRLNPTYGKALEQWSGDSASLRAMDDGANIFNSKRFTIEEIPEYLQGMPAGDRQFFILGVASKLKDMLLKKVDAADKGGIVNTEDVRRRLRPLFQSQAHADEFLSAIERERVMKRTPTTVYGGAPTAERVAADVKADSAFGIADAGRRLVHGDYVGAARAALRVLQRNRKPDAALNEAIANILTDPNVILNIQPGANIIPR